MNYQEYEKASRAALGLIDSDLVLKNANIINVFTEEIYKTDIAIYNGLIVGLGKYKGKVEIDLEGKYVCPGFIDSHLHLESTLVPPAVLIHNAVLWGTTTFIVDPHESVNVSGCDGIEYILEQTNEVPANVYVMMPSCVPATPMEDNGCTFTAEDMKKYIHHPRILGLGEVMDYNSVVSAEQSMFEKLDLFRDKVIDGHAPFLSNEQLASYALAGIATDHECCDFEYALKESRNGMQVLIREGSAAKNLEAIVKGIIENNIEVSRFSFCTDDKHIEEIREEGHISYNVKKAIALGLSPLKAIKMATINAARCYGLKHLGAIAPGYQADLVVLNDLDNVVIESVYHKGKLIDNNTPIVIPKPKDHIKNTVKVKEVTKEMLMIKASQDPVSVLQMIDQQIITKHIKVEVPSQDGYFVPNKIYNKAAVIERHKLTGKIGLAVVSGFGISNGAIASSVSHDSHNIIVIGDNDHDILLAVEELVSTQGGYTIVENGKVLETLPLPIMGLISDLEFSEVHSRLKTMIQHAHRMGVPENMDPFITLSFIALPVIPEIRITTNGLYDVVNGKFITYN
ncbi:adenine deaminase [Defluviitalea saccharophila]|uniref:Adenine deaminase n=1 Tax=Defluviitalea saccharophila TaxID=879970 RepID=A0ABZ2Y626_9FIRM|nr:adenine deaminase [Candidatus Epulonipiscium sp.]